MADWVALIPGCMYLPGLHIWSYGFDKWTESVSLRAVSWQLENVES